jgi:hypothetical protein
MPLSPARNCGNDERFHMRNVLIIQPAPCVNLGSASEVILPRSSSCWLCPNQFLSSSNNSGHGVDAMDRGTSRGLVVSLAFLRAVNPAQANTFRAGVVQDFNSVTVEDATMGPEKSAKTQ